MTNSAGHQGLLDLKCAWVPTSANHTWGAYNPGHTVDVRVQGKNLLFKGLGSASMFLLEFRGTEGE